MEVKLLQPYVCDVEWWIAYPADPRFTYHDPGEIYWATDEEAQDMIRDGIAVPVETD
jgi:hypothetical protein